MSSIVCIYKIISPIGKVYIGSTSNYKRRMLEHANADGHRKLTNSIKKYGWNSHTKEIIEFCTIDSLRKLEIAYKLKFVEEVGWHAALFHKIDDSSHYVRSDSFVEQMRQLALNRWKDGSVIGMRGKSHSGVSNEIRNKTRKDNNSAKHTQETKDKISVANKGKVHSNISKEKMSLAKKGKKLSEDHRIALKKAKGLQMIIVCPHCNQQGGNAMKRWHFDNCKKIKLMENKL